LFSKSDVCVCVCRCVRESAKQEENKSERSPLLARTWFISSSSSSFAFLLWLSYGSPGKSVCVCRCVCSCVCESAKQEENKSERSLLLARTWFISSSSSSFAFLLWLSYGSPGKSVCV